MWRIRTGEEVFGVLFGESGCGKSLTLKCIAGIEKPDEGRIVLNGRTLFDSEQGINVPARERRVGYLFQEYALFPHMTVEENIAVGAGVVLKQKKSGMKEKEKLVKQYIERFSHWAGKEISIRIIRRTETTRCDCENDGDRAGASLA